MFLPFPYHSLQSDVNPIRNLVYKMTFLWEVQSSPQTAWVISCAHYVLKHKKTSNPNLRETEGNMLEANICHSVTMGLNKRANVFLKT